MTISFDPKFDEQHEVLEVVALAYDTVAGGPAETPGREGSSSSQWTVDGWTAESMYRYVSALKPVARRALLAILSSSPSSADEVEEAMGVGPRRYSEAHRSLQDAVRLVPEVGRPPFDLVDDCYVVDDEVAGLVLAALDRVENNG